MAQEVFLAQVVKRAPDAAAFSLITCEVETPIEFYGKEKNGGTGVPQAMSISDVLSMIYLLDFDDVFFIAVELVLLR